MGRYREIQGDDRGAPCWRIGRARVGAARPRRHSGLVPRPQPDDGALHGHEHARRVDRREARGAGKALLRQRLLLLLLRQRRLRLLLRQRRLRLLLRQRLLLVLLR